ncbi:MAG: Ni/Fe-hydrogenase cytochrome b subunit, partial [bacterium]|nr:Ni/Fe-hydrogenase cytochrome b subunit [bacterium]
FEVAACVALYLTVLFVEFSSAPLEWLGLKRARNLVIRLTMILTILGVILSTMHQSSLGSLMIISGHKLNPLWQTTLLPLLFLLSAITMGYCAVVFESYLASRAFKRPAETPILAKVSGIVAWLLVFFLVFRFGDLVIRGQLGLAFRGDLNGNMFLIESLLFIVPAVMLLPKANRSKPRTLFSAGGLMLLAGAVYRLNVFLVGFNPASGWRYFPSVAEMTITLGVIALEVMLYLIIVKKFPVLPRLEHA